MRRLLCQFKLPVQDAGLLSQSLAKGLGSFTGIDWRSAIVPHSLVIEVDDEAAESLLNNEVARKNLCRHISIEIGQKVLGVEVLSFAKAGE